MLVVLVCECVVVVCESYVDSGGCGVHTTAHCSLQSPVVMQLKTIMKQKNRAAWVQESQKKMVLSKEMFLPVTAQLEPGTQPRMLNDAPSCVCVCGCVGVWGASFPFCLPCLFLGRL